MDDYSTLNLSEFCNAGVTLLGPGSIPLIGQQSLRGLPFRIAPDPERCFVAFGEGLRSHPLFIPIGQTALSVIVAHALLESNLLEGGPLGETVAEYVFRYGDGEEVRVPICERFEIGVVPAIWGQLAFDAVPDCGDSLPPRYEGRFDSVGLRQAEVRKAWPRCCYLWAWLNPRPEEPLALLAVIPKGPRFLIAGITLGRVDENPFVQFGARPVKIVLIRPEDADRAFDLEVDVDRGTATFPYSLPVESADEFLADPLAGWGQKLNQHSSPAYVQIAAIPSATVTIKQAGEPRGEATWRDLEEKRSVDTGSVRLELVDPGLNWVKTTVVDDATGQPVSCRVHFRSPDGIPYQPHGHHSHVNGDGDTNAWHLDVGGDVRLGQISYAYINGTCEGWLPRGEVLVDVARGFEYDPLRTRVTIEPGQRDLRLRLRRWCEMNAQGWFSGDTHVHFVSTAGAHIEALGEDLNVVNLLLTQLGSLFTNTEDFTGRPSVSSDGRTIVHASQENRQHQLGHLSLLGLKEPVMPWCSDGPPEDEMGGILETTLAHWADRCHEQGGTVIIPHLPNPNGSVAALIASNRADALEMGTQNAYSHLEYYRYLNCGYRLPLVGGTDKMTSSVPVGVYRTYVSMAPDMEFTFDNWCSSLRAGRTFLSSGPLISLTVDGHAIGDTVFLPGNGGTVEVEAQAESIFPIHRLELVEKGRVVAATEESNGARQLRLKTTVAIKGHTWLAARAGASGLSRATSHWDDSRRGIFAHTSPVYVACGGDWWLFDRDTAQYMLTLVGGCLTYIRKHSLQYRPGSISHHHGEEDHQAYLERPFEEARAAIHRRMHERGIGH